MGEDACTAVDKPRHTNVQPFGPFEGLERRCFVPSTMTQIDKMQDLPKLTEEEIDMCRKAFLMFDKDCECLSCSLPITDYYAISPRICVTFSKWHDRRQGVENGAPGPGAVSIRR